MAYTKTNWSNDTAPAINEENLNKIENGIYDAHLKNEELNNEINKINSINEYNEYEKIVGKWINNKPIYRKVIKTSISQSEVSIQHNIENLDLVIDKRILLKGPGYTAVNTNMATTGNYIYNWLVNNTSVKIFNSINFSGDCYIILEYTKTTD